MKKSFVRTACMSLLSFIIFSPSTQAFSSFGTRGGGNANVAEFYHLGEELLVALAPLSPLKISDSQIDIKAMQKIFKHTRVMAAPEPLLLNGASVEAINYPDRNLVAFRVTDWRTHTNELKSQLVIHEILGLARIADPEFKVSRQLLNIVVGSTEYNAELAASEQTCDETRTFTGPKAKALLSALLHAGIEPIEINSLATYQAPILECNASITPYEDGIARGSCNQTIQGTDATALEITNALWGMGIFADGAMGHMWAAASDITCTVSTGADGRTNAYQCSLTGTWSFGCPVH